MHHNFIVCVCIGSTSGCLCPQFHIQIVTGSVAVDISVFYPQKCVMAGGIVVTAAMNTTAVVSLCMVKTGLWGYTL